MKYLFIEIGMKNFFLLFSVTFEYQEREKNRNKYTQLVYSYVEIQSHFSCYFLPSSN